MAELRQRMPRQRDKAYMGYIASLSCVLCGAAPEVAHVRFTEQCSDCGGYGRNPTPMIADCMRCQGTGHRFGKRPTGAGEKPSDRWTLPLCPEHHRLGKEAQHSHGEREWWQGIDALWLCYLLQTAWDTSKSRAEAIERGMQVIREAQQ